MLAAAVCTTGLATPARSLKNNRTGITRDTITSIAQKQQGPYQRLIPQKRALLRRTIVGDLHFFHASQKNRTQLPWQMAVMSAGL